MGYYLTRAAVAFLFGLVIGCYLNTLEYRLRSDLKLSDGDCHCTKCGAKIRLRDQIPVIGYLMLGGKCRNCGAGIGINYPLVEAGSALFYMICAIVTQRSILGFAVITIIANLLFVFISNAIRGRLAFGKKQLAGICSLLGLHLVITIGMAMINIVYT